MTRDLTDPNYLRSIGADDADIPAVIASEIESRQRHQQQHVAGVLEAAQMAVLTGEATQAEVATILHAHGEREAHAAFVADWEREEREYAAEERVTELSFADVEEYKKLIGAVEADDRAKNEAEVARLKQQLDVTKVTEIQKDLKAFVDSVPGAHNLAPAVERQLVSDLQASGVLPSTPEERQVLIETALKKTAVLDNATESIKQQLDQEWRIHRKNNGATDGLTTAANIATAEKHWKEARFEQLADAKMIDLDSLKPGPTADEESAAITERFRSKQEKSTVLHQSVAGIAERGADANATRDRGIGIGEEKAAFHEALARAEAEANFGTAEIKTGYGPAAADPNAKPGGYGPDGTWPDELGPAL